MIPIDAKIVNEIKIPMPQSSTPVGDSRNIKSGLSYNSRTVKAYIPTEIVKDEA